VDKAPIITQEDGIQPEILRASAVEEQPIIDSSRKKEACIFFINLQLFPFNSHYA
jgi:hypothetical protein